MTAFLLVLALALASCGGPTPTDPDLTEEPEPEEPEPEEPEPEEPVPAGWPLVPRPSHANDFDVPDASDTLVVVMPIEGKDVDFAPTWTEGTFTWDIDIQTQYELWSILDGWVLHGDAPGDYGNVTAHSSELVYENGAVDLTSPTPKNSTVIAEIPRYEPMPRDLIFVQDGAVLGVPHNPRVATYECSFLFQDYFSAWVYFDPCVFVGHHYVPVDNGFGQRNRRRAYYVAATSAPLLTNPVYLARKRFWERVLVDGTKSVRADPGFSKSVAYTRTTGTSTSSSYEFARSLDTELTVGVPDVIAASLGGSLGETFTTTREVREEESLKVTHEVTGLDGKTVIFSVWRSVERYTFVDEDGNPYTDPNYTFAALGKVDVRGDHEILQSAIFDHPE